MPSDKPSSGFVSPGVLDGSPAAAVPQNGIFRREREYWTMSNCQLLEPSAPEVQLPPTIVVCSRFPRSDLGHDDQEPDRGLGRRCRSILTPP
jgi:hypothetical protein